MYAIIIANYHSHVDELPLILIVWFVLQQDFRILRRPPAIFYELDNHSAKYE